jgi:hypothetical protein
MNRVPLSFIASASKEASLSMDLYSDAYRSVESKKLDIVGCIDPVHSFCFRPSMFLLFLIEIAIFIKKIL